MADDSVPLSSAQPTPPPGTLATLLGYLKSGASAVGDSFTGMAQHGLQAQQNFLDGIDPNTGQPAVSPYDRANTLAHFFTSNLGPQSAAGVAAGPIEGALGAGATIPRSATQIINDAARADTNGTIGRINESVNMPRTTGETIPLSTLDSPRPYQNVPDSLMGFRKRGPNVPYESSNYPFSQWVKVKFPNQDEFVDAQKGMNQAHALERARRNWDGAQITPIDKPAGEE